MARNRHQFTIYDKMDADGVFDSNPANSSARGPHGEQLYKGPVKFPKMVYHPEGKKQRTVPATIVATPTGPQAVGEQWELINKICEDKDSYDAAKEAGWKDTPAESIAMAQAAPELLKQDATASGVADLALAEANRKIEELTRANAQLTKDAASGSKNPIPTKNGPAGKAPGAAADSTEE